MATFGVSLYNFTDQAIRTIKQTKRVDAAKFTEGFDTRDLEEEKALLGELG